MPNPLGRKRGGTSEEVSQLKKELEELRANYARDMSLIGGDIRDLDNRISSVVEPTPTPASDLPAGGTN